MRGGWQPLTPIAAFDVTSSLGYRDGTIYYTSLLAGGITALPVTGGPATTIATGPFEELWVEGDRLLVAGGGQGTQFFDVPISGGTPTLLLDGSAGRTDAGYQTAYAVTATDFFWLEERPPPAGPGPTAAWRASRSTGAVTPIGSASAVYPGGDILVLQHMAVGSDAVVMAESLGIAAAVPFDGSATRTLATSDDLTKARGDYAGIDAAGVYWTVPRAGARAEDDAWSVAIAPADGGPLRTVWDGLPAHSSIWGMWPDGEGGWVAAVGQRFDDLQDHIGIWTIDANWQGRRLACSPAGDGSSIPNVRVRPAIAPDAIYVEDSASKFQIVRIPR